MGPTLNAQMFMMPSQNTNQVKSSVKISCRDPCVCNSHYPNFWQPGTLSTAYKALSTHYFEGFSTAFLHASTG
eukprot:5859170-Amphidinium_carterae.1